MLNYKANSSCVFVNSHDHSVLPEKFIADHPDGLKEKGCDQSSLLNIYLLLKKQ